MKSWSVDNIVHSVHLEELWTLSPQSVNSIRKARLDTSHNAGLFFFTSRGLQCILFKFGCQQKFITSFQLLLNGMQNMILNSGYTISAEGYMTNSPPTHHSLFSVSPHHQLVPGQSTTNLQEKLKTP